jgi:HEAT repeat protein
VPGPGLYCLTVKMRPAPEESRQGGFIEDVPPPIHRVRFTVDEATENVAVDFEKPVDPTVAFVHETLDSEGPLNVSWSHTDVQAAMLVGYADRAGAAAELLRILGDDQAPHDWKYPSLQALGGMTETPGVIEGLLALVDKPAGDLRPSQLFAPLHRATQHVDVIVERIGAHYDDDNWRTRWSAQYYLGRMAHEQPQIKDRVIPILLAGLRDPIEQIRSDAAATLGWLDAKQAADDLRTLLDDPNYKVRLWAARSIWQTSGDQQPLLAIATELLCRDDDDYEAKKDAAYALREIKDIPQEAIDALTRFASNQDMPPFNDHKTLLQFQLGRVARGILEEQD